MQRRLVRSAFVLVAHELLNSFPESRVVSRRGVSCTIRSLKLTKFVGENLVAPTTGPGVSTLQPPIIMTAASSWLPLLLVAAAMVAGALGGTTSNGADLSLDSTSSVPVANTSMGTAKDSILPFGKRRVCVFDFGAADRTRVAGPAWRLCILYPCPTSDRPRQMIP